MIRDITLGQYYDTESIIHRLDPRLKICSAILYIIFLFAVSDFYGFALAFVFIAAVIALSRVPVSFIFRGLKVVFILILFTFVLNLFMYDGRVLVGWWKLTITDTGLYKAVFMAVRLVLLIASASVLTLTTTPLKLTDGIESLLKPFAKIGLPAHDIAMMMTIALRFIPTLLEETDKIMKAQQARGADFESGNIMKRARHMVPILIPLFVSAFRIAQDMAYAMEARCYHGGEGRTRMNAMKFAARDAVAGAIMLAFIAGIVLIRIFL